MSDESTRAPSPLGMLFTFFLVVVLPLALGLFLAPRLVPVPKVGILRMYYDINPDTALEFKQQMEYARNDRGIRAIVVVVDSPGGTASDSEEIYLEILKTRQQMPVLVTVDFLAASGGYFTAAAADEIYAKTSSLVGNIGVRSGLPVPPFLDPTTITTGPYKDTGLTVDGQIRRVESLKFTFLDAVATGRGERLTASLDFLSRGEVFNGVEAQDMGLIDGIASTEEVIDRAARLAGLNNYEQVELYPLTFFEDEAQVAAYRPPTINLERLFARPTDLPPGIYYRYQP